MLALTIDRVISVKGMADILIGFILFGFKNCS